jgi:hypothetical protein
LHAVFQPLRTAISLAVLAGAIWAAFTVDLGGRSFAEHVDTISETPEAEQLIEGTRSRINPALQEVRDRVLGEYVEAPTWIPDASDPAKVPTHDRDETVTASTLGVQTGFEPKLPGRRASTKAKPTKHEQPREGKSHTRDEDPVDTSEPLLPGRRRSR